MRCPGLLAFSLGASLVLAACGGSDSRADAIDDDPPVGPYGEPDPGRGPHFTAGAETYVR